MTVVLIISLVLLFAFFAHWFEHKQNVEEVKIHIDKEIKAGNLIRLSDNSLALPNELSEEQKKLTYEFLFLLENGIKEKELLEKNYSDLKKLKASKSEELRRKELEKYEEEQKEIQIQKIEKEKTEKRNNWVRAKSLCKNNFDLNIPGIYLIHSMNTNDFYVGSSKNIQNRKKQHLYSLKNGKHHSYLMNEHFKEYGIRNFQFHLIEEIDLNSNQFELEGREQYYLDKLQPSYNYWLDIKASKRHFYNPKT